MKRRGKLGGQNKVPRVINDQALFDDLKRFGVAVEGLTRSLPLAPSPDGRGSG
jgi:hypothetical protein